MLRYIMGQLLLTEGALMSLSMIVMLIYGETGMLYSVLIPLGALFLLGFLLAFKKPEDKTLSANLKELEADRLIVRKEYPQIPPKVEYSLSDRGKSLMTVLDQLCVWGEENKE